MPWRIRVKRSGLVYARVVKGVKGRLTELSRVVSASTASMIMSSRDAGLNSALRL